jgi:hypothetical protein
MTQAKRFLGSVAALLLSLSLCTCNRASSGQSAQASSSTDQSSANQQAAADTSANNNPSSNATSQSSGQVSSDNRRASAPNQAATATQAPAPIAIPAGTSITVRLQESLSSASAIPGERFEAVIDEPVAVGNEVVLPVGTFVSGHVTLARRSGRLRHPGELGLTLDTVTVGQQQVPLSTSNIVVRGASHKKRNWGWIGGGTGGGALVGALAAGGKGALIGSGIGAAAGTTTAFLTGKKNVGFAAERRLRFRLRNDVYVPPENG